MSYVAIHSEGGLLPLDVIERIGREELPGQKAADFGLPKGARLTDEIAVAWSDAVNQWDIFKRHRARVPEEETGTTVTRERWMLPLLMQSLGYADLTFQPAGAQIEGKLYPISHRAGKGEEGPPIHIEGCRVDLDRRPPTGHRRLSPHALVQEYLNREEKHLWGIVTNGLHLRVLRTTSFTSRPAYLEFDLESILEGNRYNEFALFYRLCHRTRLPREGEDPAKCFLETYYQEAIEQGGRVREKLRGGVEEALKKFGSGFLQHPGNEELREKLKSGKLRIEDYHQQLLRLVYRLLFLMVAEERHMIVPEGAEADRFQGIYDRHYGITRLRELAEHIFEKSTYGDLWLGLKKTFRLFSESETGNPLSIPPLNGDLFGPHAMPDLEETYLFNHELIVAIRRLSLFEDNKVRRRVNYAALDVEELGSVYESLLDFQPAIEETSEGPIFVFRTGTERKSTGSYYTRPELVRELIESALVPVTTERLAAAKTNEEKAKAILSMKVCDPACGSGHFLLAAARRLGKELARRRTGEEEPTPREFHLAVRDVISHCIYGVDVNPLAVDLCKLSLWLEGHWTGKPLSFLDHHIKCGNSLIGVFDPEVLKQGIPDDAFKPVTGDDKKAASAIRKRNKKERESPTRRLPFERTSLGRLEDYAKQLGELSEVAEDSPADVKRKAEIYHKIHDSAETHRVHRAANIWTAAFFVPLKDANDHSVPTTESLWEYMERPNAAYAPMVGLADSLAGKDKHNFFHWFLEFPEVFANGGFDIVLGNPPWDKIQPEEEKFFATIRPDIADAATAKIRKELIARLPLDDPLNHRRWVDHQRGIEGLSKFLKFSGALQFSIEGNLNSYRVFTEVSAELLCNKGRAGLVVQTGLATDESGKELFDYLLSHKRLLRFLDFENREMFFPDVDERFRFSLITIGGSEIQSAEGRGQFGWLLRNLGELGVPERLVRLSASDLVLFNPSSRTCPVFTSIRDFALSRAIYQRGEHIFVDDNHRLGKIDFLGELFNMTRDAVHFSPKPTASTVSLYEAKHIYQLDHRFSTSAAGDVRETTAQEKEKANFLVTPRSWVEKEVVHSRASNRGIHSRWMAGFRSIASATNERTAIFAVFPFSGVGNSINMVLGLDSLETAYLMANANALVFDFCARQKISGSNVNIWIFKQLPAIPFERYAERCPWGADIHSLNYRLLPRVVELTYTAWDIKGFPDDLWRESNEGLKETIRCQWEENKAATGGHEWNPPEWAEIAKDGIPVPPFKWDEDRRAHLRAELDAYYALLYGLNRKQLRYILDPADLTKKELEDILDPWEEVSDPLDDEAYRQRVAQSDFPGETFRVLKEKELKLYGQYRTRRLVLEAFEKLAASPRFRNGSPSKVVAAEPGVDSSK